MIKNGSAARAALRLLRSQWQILSIGFLLVVIGRVASFGVPVAMRSLIDDVFAGGDYELLPLLGALVVAVTVIGAAARFLSTRIIGSRAEAVTTDWRQGLQVHVLSLPTAYFAEARAGTTASRVVADPNSLRNLIGTGIINVMGGVVTAAIAFVMLVKISWSLSCLVLLPMCVYSITSKRFLRTLRTSYAEQSRLQAALTGRFAESIAGIEIVKVYAAEDREAQDFKSLNDTLLTEAQRLIRLNAGLALASSLALGLITALIIMVGGIQVARGQVSVGDLVAFTGILGMVVAPLLGIGTFAKNVSQALAGLDRIEELRSVDPEYVAADDCATAVEVAGSIRFESVTFSYDKRRAAVNNVAFVVDPGSTVALVGPSGAGKTTLLTLLMRFRLPDSGRILIDGVDLAELSLREYRAQVGVVLQEGFLFDGTIADNIRMGRWKITDSDIAEACAFSNCQEFIDDLPDGLQTQIGQRGVRLSGGQRQRLALARALAGRPRLLALDEPTSALDGRSEQLIQRALKRLHGTVTTLIIAHRLSTIEMADKIVVLDGGRIVQTGTHAQLVSTDGLYRRLYDSASVEAAGGTVMPLVIA